MTPDGQAIAKLRYSHEAMIDVIVAQPWLKQRELAAMFGRTESWISLVMSSDVFKDRLAERRAEIVDPTVVAELETMFEGLAKQSARVLMDKLDATRDSDVALQALTITSKALGYGAKDRGAAVQVNNYVVSAPAQAPDGASWLAGRRPELKLVEPPASAGLQTGFKEVSGLQPAVKECAVPRRPEDDLAEIDALRGL